MSISGDVSALSLRCTPRYEVTVKLKPKGPPPVSAAPPVCSYERVKPYWERPSSSWMSPLSHSPPCCHPPGSAALPSQTWELTAAEKHTHTQTHTFHIKRAHCLLFSIITLASQQSRCYLWITDLICERLIYGEKYSQFGLRTTACTWCWQQRIQVSCVLLLRAEA